MCRQARHASAQRQQPAAAVIAAAPAAAAIAAGSTAKSTTLQGSNSCGCGSLARAKAHRVATAHHKTVRNRAQHRCQGVINSSLSPKETKRTSPRHLDTQILICTQPKPTCQQAPCQMLSPLGSAVHPSPCCCTWCRTQGSEASLAGCCCCCC